MCQYKIYKTYQYEEWNYIVKQFDSYEVFYLVEYVQAFEELGTDEGILFYYNDGITSAINVIFKRDIAECEEFVGKIEKGKYYDLITPYGYGGMLIQGPNIEGVWDVYRKFCINANIVSEFVRFGLFSQSIKYYIGKCETRTHNIVRYLDLPQDDLLMDFEHKVRKNLKKAYRNQLTAIIDEEGTWFEDFLLIYYDTMKRNQADAMYYFPRTFFEKFKLMRKNAAWFYVMKNDKIISVELVLYNERNCYSFLGGSLSEYFEYRPNDFLKFEIMKWAKKKGITNFILGGGYGKDDGIFKYKQSFAPGGVYDFYIGMNILNADIYEMLVGLRKADENFDENTQYFPKYRG